MAEDSEKRKRESRLVRKIKASAPAFAASLILLAGGIWAPYEFIQECDVTKGLGYSLALGFAIGLTTAAGLSRYGRTN